MFYVFYKYASIHVVKNVYKLQACNFHYFMIQYVVYQTTGKRFKMNELTFSSPVSALHMISGVREKLFKKLGVVTASDLAYYFPFRYENRGNTKKISDLVPGELASVIVEVANPCRTARIPQRSASSPKSIQRIACRDETGVCTLTFFNNNYIGSTLTVGRRLRIYGKVSESSASHGVPEFVSPDYELIYDGKPLRDILPVYSLTAGLSQKILRNAVSQAISLYDDPKFETLPHNILRENDLCTLCEALHGIHFPSDEENLACAVRRLAFDELLDFQIKLLGIKQNREKASSFRIDCADTAKFESMLDFPLTGAQKRAISDVLSDMNRGDGECNHPMKRLVQGDVGCGKTLIAAAAVYAVASSGRQSAMMAPTEILAEQHYKSLYDLFEKLGIRSALLTGSTKASQKRTILHLLREGEIDFIVGTHALIEENVVFSSLSLVITDEQHRFGVEQRDRLSSKESVNDTSALKPHMLVMSATPIPRTLAMMLYGDLDISIVDEMPPGRQTVDTFAVGEEYRKRLDAFIAKHVDEGRQIYVVCPMIENDDENIIGREKAALANVTECAERLRERFPSYSVGLLHGKLKPNEKEDIMRRFFEGETDILVSTTVVEVGVNVPNATLMIIENAERFGLSQLHQLRGRVGRGSHKSYCVLMSPSLTGKPLKTNTSVAAKRLRVICGTSDGFKIAQSDLEIRGPGEFFGKRQSGDFRFRVANLMTDMELVERTREIAKDVLSGKTKLGEEMEN